MNRDVVRLIAYLSLALVPLSEACAEFHPPLGLDLYRPIPEDNPLTADKVKLGRKLFGDKILSRNRKLACKGCHQPKKAFTDGRAKAVGVYGRQGNRSVPTLVNRAYGRAFFWDGRTSTLEEQVVKPIESESEMDMTVPEVVERLRRKRRYRKMFRQAFGREINGQDLARALAGYVRTIYSGEMGYPLHSGDPNILWLGSRGLGVPVGDDRSIRRWVHGHCLLHKAVEEFSPAA